MSDLKIGEGCHEFPAALADSTLRASIEAAMRPKVWQDGHGCRVIKAADAVSVATRLVREEREKVWALEVNQDESDECAADLFSLVCAVLDGKPEAADARVQLQKHIEHVRTCRKGSCDTELHGSRQRKRAEAAERERDALKRERAAVQDERDAAEKSLAEYREKWGHVRECNCDPGAYPIDPRCAPVPR